MKLFFFTNNEVLEKIENTCTITSQYLTLFTPAPTGVYLTTTNPQEFQGDNSNKSLNCFVEIEIPKEEPLLTKCQPFLADSLKRLVNAV